LDANLGESKVNIAIVVFLTLAVLFVDLVIATSHIYAQTGIVTTSKLLAGSQSPSSISSTDPFRIIGINSTSGGASTMRPTVIDNDGDVLRDTATSVSSAGAWTHSALFTLGAGLNITGIVTPSTSTLIVDGNVSSTLGLYAFGDVPVAGQGVDNVRIGLRPTFDWPMIILEDAGFPQWSMHNDSGAFYLHRRDLATGNPPDDPAIPFKIDGNITIGPPGRRFMPSTPFGVDLGSQQFKFGAGWFGSLFVDELVAIENIGTVDNRWLIGSGNVLDEDLAPGGTSMVTRYNNYATGTFVYLQKFLRTEFIKTTSGPTLTNKISNGSFEAGTVTGWTTSSGMTGLSNVTTKSFHGERAMLADASASPSTFLYSFSTVPGTTYTTCFYARRTDGAVIDDDDVAIWHADAYTDAVAQSTLTDGWYRFCKTSTAGTSPGSQQIHINTKGVDYYIDAVQTEVTSTQRVYSEYRASYSITRNEEGGGGVANQWYAGDGMMGVGAVVGDGWLDCYAIRGIKSAAEQGPACVANVRIGSAFNAWAPFAAWGNLNGLYSFSTTRWGFHAGYEPLIHGGFDTIDGFTIKNNATLLMQFDTSGNGFLAGSLDVTNNITVGQAGAIKSGATAYDTGEGYWLDCNFTSGSCDPRFRIGTTSAGTSYLRWTGSALELKSERFTVASSGVSINTSGGLACASSLGGYYFNYGDSATNGMYSCESAGVRDLTLMSQKAGQAIVEIVAVNTSLSSTATLQLQADIGATPSFFKVFADDVFINNVQGFTGTKVAGSCTFTFTDGFVTNVTGC
jgi:hypothetical protein